MPIRHNLSIIFSNPRYNSHNIFPKKYPWKSFSLFQNVVCIIILLIGSRCAQNDEKEVVATWVKDVYSDSSWCHHYQKLLQNSYIELSPLETCIVSARLRYFQEPDLQTTLGAVRILKALDREIPNIPGSIQWVYHLRDDSSGFFNTGNLFHIHKSTTNSLHDRFRDTENALNLINALGFKLQEPAPLIQTLAGLQRKDGWFVSELKNPGLKTIDENIIKDTFQILRILIAISDSSALKLARNSSNALKTWLDEHQKSVITALQTIGNPGEVENSQEVIFFLAISEVLAQIAPEYISNNEKQVLKEIFEYIRREYLDRKETLLSYSIICFLHTVKHAVEALHYPAAQIRPLNDFVNKKLVPALQQEEFLFQNIFDFNVPAIPIELIHWTGGDIPRIPLLLETIEKYRIENGWMRIVIYLPEYSPMPAYKLWWCAQVLGMDTFDPVRLGNFFWYSLKQNYSAYAFKDWYDMFKGIHLSRQFTDDPFIQTLRDSSIQHLLNMKNDQERYGALMGWIRVAKLQSWPFPEPLRPSFINELNQDLIAYFIERNHRVNMDNLHTISFVQNYLDTCLVSPTHISSNLQELWSEKAGAFSPLLREEYPSLIATRQALEIIAFLNRPELLNPKMAKKIRQFVLSCKMKYGFSNAAPSYRNPSDFESWARSEYTYDAFLILKMLEEIQEMFRSDMKLTKKETRS